MNFINKKFLEKVNIIKYNQPYKYFKPEYKSIIPFDVYQTWNTKDLPSKMKERVLRLKKQNPKFNFYLFDDNDCREFIKNNFKTDVLDAYDCLIPGAYKADLWRLCVLFINGGIYMDIKLVCLNGFKLIELTESNHFVLDRLDNALLNSLLVSQKGNIFLYKAIRQIVKNVQSKYYGGNPLSPTGPELLYNVMLDNKYKLNIDLFHYKHGGFLIYKNIFVFSTEYSEYNEEREAQYNIIKKKHYSEMWHNKNIYS